MSERPRRSPKPRQRLQNEQAANTKSRASRSRRKRKEPNTNVVRNLNNINPQPKRRLKSNAAQDRVLTILDSISEDKNEKIFNMLYSIYRDASTTLFSRANVFELDDNELIKVLEAQYKVMSENVRSSTGGNSNTLNLSLNNRDDILDFCMLVWLDMSHDGTITTSFQTFMKGDVIKKLVSKVPQYANYTNDTLLMKRMKALRIIKTGKTKKIKGKKITIAGLWPASGFEKLIKDNLPFLFDIQAPLKTIAGTARLSDLAINREKTPIYVAIDSESEFKSISQLIDNSKYIFPGRNGPIQRYFLKPIITLSNRVDPGRLMPTKGVAEEFAKLMRNANSLKSTQLYNVTNCNFKLGSTSLTLRSTSKGRFDLKIGQKSIPYGITAGAAKTTNNINEKLSKFLGDFMQILTVLSKPVKQRIVLGTLDGVLCGMYCFLSMRLLNEEPRLFIDMSFKQQNQILMYGVSDLLKASGPVQQTRSNIGSNITRAMENMNNKEVSNGTPRRTNSTRTRQGLSTKISNNTNIKVSNGSNRSNSNYRPTSVKINNRLEGSGNSNNTNRKKTGFLGRIFGGNNTSSATRSSSGSVSKNKNNNNTNSINQKARTVVKRKLNNNVNKPSPKRQKIINTTTKNNQRVKFIKNLNKFTNLSQRTKRGYIQNFNNGQDINKLLREAKNENNKLKIATTTIRKNTLRKSTPQVLPLNMFGIRNQK